MPETVTFEVTRTVIFWAWVAFFGVGFILIVSLLSLLKIMRMQSLQLDFLIYLKSLLQEMRGAMREADAGGEGGDEGREPPTRPAGDV